MDKEGDAEKIHQRRYNRDAHNGEVGDLGPLAHDKSPGAHNGRHQLAAGGSGGLDPAGELGFEADPFHQGDGNGASAHGVGNGAAGDRSHQPAGEHGHFGGTADHAPHQGDGKADNEIAGAGFEQERSEQDEQKDKSGRDGGDGTEDAVGREEHAIKHALDGHPRKVPDAAEPVSEEKGVSKEKSGNHRDDIPHRPAGDFQCQQNGDAGENQIGEHGNFVPGMQGVFKEDKIQPGRQSDERQ